mgnify:FL=1
MATSKLVLYESDLSSSIAEIAPALKNQKLVRWFDSYSSPSEKVEYVEGALTLDEVTLSRSSTERIGDEWRRGVGWQDPACLIFTSGTTGLPKAASCTHGRVATAFKVCHRFVQDQNWVLIALASDVDSHQLVWPPDADLHSYASLPLDCRCATPALPTNDLLTPSLTALLAIGVSWNAGSTVIIGRRFSASHFWNEVSSAQANVCQYVGEVLRYLVRSPAVCLKKDGS